MSGIKIVVIDSGINKEYQQYCCGGHELKLVNNKISYENTYWEEGFHGTLCSAIINNIVPTAEIYHIKIVDKGISSSELLLRALEDVLFIDCKIVNISMATKNLKYKIEYEDICRRLKEQNKIIVASSMNGSEIEVYPASSNDVLGVTGDEKARKEILFNGGNYQCKACIEPEIVNLFGKENMFFMGKSKATAIVSGVCGNIALLNPNITQEEILNILREKSIRYEQEEYEYSDKVVNYMRSRYGKNMYEFLVNRCRDNYKECINIINEIEERYPEHARIFYGDFVSVSCLERLFEYRWMV